MRAILILLLSVITLSVTAQQRYRVTSKTEWQYDTAKREYIPESITKYDYVQGSTRGSNYESDTVLYDTMRVYQRNYDSIRLSKLVVNHYMANDLLDTAYHFHFYKAEKSLHHISVCLYDEQEHLVSQTNYGQAIGRSWVHYLDSNEKYIRPSIDFGFRMYSRDSFKYHRNKFVYEQRQCLFYNCEVVADQMETLDSPYIYDWYKYTYDDTLLIGIDGMRNNKHYKVSIRYNENGKQVSWCKKQLVAGKYMVEDTVYTIYGKNKRTSYSTYYFIFNPPVKHQDEVMPTKYTEHYYTDAQGQTTTHVLFYDDGNNDGIEMKEWRYEYNKEGKETLWSYNRYLDAKDRKPLEICEHRTSYTPFGYVAEQIKDDYIDPDTGEAQIKTKTTYTYEAY